jgi:hypothetical protein
MDQLTELFKQMQELAGVGLDMLQGAHGAAGDAKGGAPHPGGGAPFHGGGAPHQGGAPAPDPDRAGDGGAPHQGAPKPPPFGR